MLEDVLINQVEYRTHGMHSTNTEITDRSAKGDHEGEGQRHLLLQHSAG